MSSSNGPSKTTTKEKGEIPLKEKNTGKRKCFVKEAHHQEDGGSRDSTSCTSVSTQSTPDLCEENIAVPDVNERLLHVPNPIPNEMDNREPAVDDLVYLQTVPRSHASASTTNRVTVPNPTPNEMDNREPAVDDLVYLQTVPRSHASASTTNRVTVPNPTPNEMDNREPAVDDLVYLQTVPRSHASASTTNRVTVPNPTPNEMDNREPAVDDLVYLQTVPRSHASASTTDGTTISLHALNQKDNGNSLIDGALDLRVSPGYSSITSQIQSQLPNILEKCKRLEQQDPQNETTLPTRESIQKEHSKDTNLANHEKSNGPMIVNENNSPPKIQLKRKTESEEIIELKRQKKYLIYACNAAQLEKILLLWDHNDLAKIYKLKNHCTLLEEENACLKKILHDMYVENIGIAKRVHQKLLALSNNHILK
nr:MAG: hypothetical protein [Marsupenaeus japonicus endogenous nimavirus]